MPKHGVAFGETLRYINFIRRLHYFDAEVFKEITGIDVEEE